MHSLRVQRNLCTHAHLLASVQGIAEPIRIHLAGLPGHTVHVLKANWLLAEGMLPPGRCQPAGRAATDCHREEHSCCAIDTHQGR